MKRFELLLTDGDHEELLMLVAADAGATTATDQLRRALRLWLRVRAGEVFVSRADGKAVML